MTTWRSLTDFERHDPSTCDLLASGGHIESDYCQFFWSQRPTRFRDSSHIKGGLDQIEADR
ncbi:hypothetical protein JAAARDRAFT_36946 [Jaapia argillacea MUCL 33604]|uniref:Uncharacterized protein n=1 Tax=Jaapia argillacea MUCL 33604 TaxID=933084 RepID=A0A067Q0M1_9AGAM|nr:hypothetical protein JAAARDRAFT_36946 [Jaapia argillacea MUCL 33604]